MKKIRKFIVQNQIVTIKMFFKLKKFSLVQWKWLKKLFNTHLIVTRTNQGTSDDCGSTTWHTTVTNRLVAYYLAHNLFVTSVDIKQNKYWVSGCQYLRNNTERERCEKVLLPFLNFEEDLWKLFSRANSMHAQWYCDRLTEQATLTTLYRTQNTFITSLAVCSRVLSWQSWNLSRTAVGEGLHKLHNFVAVLYSIKLFLYPRSIELDLFFHPDEFQPTRDHSALKWMPWKFLMLRVVGAKPGSNL